VEEAKFRQEGKLKRRGKKQKLDQEKLAAALNESEGQNPVRVCQEERGALGREGETNTKEEGKRRKMGGSEGKKGLGTGTENMGH